MSKRIICILLLVSSLFMIGCSSLGNSLISNKANDPVYSDDIVDIYFVKLFQDSSLKGNGSLTIRIVNKTDNNISLLTSTSYINDNFAVINFPTFVNVEAKKDSSATYVFNYSSNNLEKIDDVNKIEMSFMMTTENKADMPITPKITIFDTTK